MSFVKGAVVGIAAGTVIGAMNKGKIMKLVKNGKRKMYKFKKYGFSF